MNDIASSLQRGDADLANLLQRELERQRSTLTLIPSENLASIPVLAALGSVATNKYSEGYPGKRYYGGNAVIDDIETLAKQRACALFGARHANVQPYSGSPANLAVYVALLKPGETVMGMSLPHGGHLTHGWKVSVTGKYFRAVQYPVGDDGWIDYDVVRSLAKKERPKLIIAGATAYPRLIDFAAFRSIADDVGAYLLADIAHIAGLVAGGAHPSPLPHADVVTSTTHKTLRGPRGAFILTNVEDRFAQENGEQPVLSLADRIDRAVFPGLQGGPHNHVTASMAVAFHEAGQPSFQRYAHDVVENAKALAETLLNAGIPLITGGTDTHLLVCDLRPLSINGKQAETLLERAGVIVNKNMIPNDPGKPMAPSGIRLGTPLLTTRGLGTDDLRRLGECIASMLRSPDDPSVLDRARKVVRDLCERYPIYPELRYGNATPTETY